MCRNIKPLFNFDPPATDEEIYDAALQFVRKISGFHHPSQVNKDAFNEGVSSVAEAAHHLLNTLTTDVHSKNREVEAAKVKARNVERFRRGA